jgi:hypothetical protein
MQIETVDFGRLGGVKDDPVKDGEEGGRREGRERKSEKGARGRL